MPTQTLQQKDQPVTIALVGGGSGGHITPLLAVAQELKKQQPDCHLVYIGEKSGKFSEVIKESKLFNQVLTVRAGKFRRYHNDSWLTRLFDVKTNLLNIRDAIYVAIGLRQSRKLLKKVNPNLVFIKGGFVGVPVGWACAKLGIAYITHDSDAVPGLANRLLARNAFLHTVGMPKRFYKYPPEKTEEVGIPLVKEYEPITPQLMQQYRRKLQLPQEARILFITGGSQGAQRINTFLSLIAEELLSENPDLYILHQAGRGNTGVYSGLPKDLQPRVRIIEFIDDMYLYSGAADIVVARAGASTIAELALQGKACILIPNPFLTGGHQLVNAQLLAENGAVKVIHEETIATDPKTLLVAIHALLADDSTRRQLEQNLQALAHPNAAAKLATIILESVEYLQEQKGS
jgi:UDP-N-acetylglucosamine--N-acetylmuramyl-(pentapeptide) pyrophosphoryl-undecaprenol N-acetylglucosamine transferase